jgi:ribose-phosphate pyrophosphokinase
MRCEFVALHPSQLARHVASAYSKPLHHLPITVFADGELALSLAQPELFYQKTVIIIESTGSPVNEQLLAVAFLAHALKNGGAVRVIAVLPYCGYSRQERAPISHKTGSLAVVARLLEGAGIDELFVVQPHTASITMLFTIPVHTITVAGTIRAHIQAQEISPTTCLVAPDTGIRAMVAEIAAQLCLPLLTVTKERLAPDQTRIVAVDGERRGSTAIIIDDIIATGGTVLNVASWLTQQGFKDIYGYFVHPVLAGDAVARLRDSEFSLINVSNTLPLSEYAQQLPMIRQFDVSHDIVAALKNFVR